MGRHRRWLVTAAIALVVTAVAAVTVAVVRTVAAGREADRLCSLVVSERDRLLAAPFADGPRPVFAVGDSYSQGTGLGDGGDPARAWPALVARQLSATVTVDGAGSTGFTTSGYCDGPWLTYGSRVAGDPAADLAADVAVVQGGVNDAFTGDPGAVEGAAAAVLEQLRAVATVVVVGPVDAPGADPARVAAVDRALQRATAAAQRVYVPLVSQPIELGPDQLHPTAAGQQQIADLVVAAVA